MDIIFVITIPVATEIYGNFAFRTGPPPASIIELDDGKILTGKTYQFDGKNPWVSC